MEISQPVAIPENTDAPPEEAQEEVSVAEETPEVETPPPVTDKLTAFERALQARKEKSEAAQYKAELEKLRSQLSERDQTSQQEMAQYRQFFAQLKKDPISALQQMGVGLEDLTEQAAHHGTFEAKLNAQLRQTEEKLSALEKYNKELYEYVKSREENLHQSFAQARAEKEKEILLSHADPEKYQYAASEWDEEELVSQARELAHTYCTKTGEPYAPFDFLMEALDDIARRKQERRESLKSKVKVPPAKPGAKAKSPSTGATPKDIREMSDEEEKEYLKNMLKNLG